ncbi:hypothetical protein KGF56_003871 [Candida oxycetoniae]|uniref:Mitochondrial fusion and transport protein UGO1 n=1 Tax=Candida oxycetoniae TaxID=497107 RepID=A0AAI9SUF9_9ASCO|nr:uncharacterized protein KGF56_003871 [Candida oxycetoniae]KAI3403283.2 hypothetical protein KGF56_003871 [Candida oxycetoniae]
MSSSRLGSSSGNLDSSSLRPYYDHDTFDAGYSVIFKKGIGLFDPKTNQPVTVHLSSNTVDNAVNMSSNGRGVLQSGVLQRAFGRQTGGIGINGIGVREGAIHGGSGGGGDKNIIYDLEFNEYFDINNLYELMKNLVWNFIKSYVKVLLAQPLEITRLVLQVGKFNLDDGKKKDEDTKEKRLLERNNNVSTVSISKREENVLNLSSKVNFIEDDEPIDYFQPQNDQQVWSNPQSIYDPLTLTPQPQSQPQSQSSSSSIVVSQPDNQPVPPPLKRLSTKKRLKVSKIQPKSLHTIDIISEITQKDSFLALFRGANSSFIYVTLSHTIEAWITGFLSPFLGIPDPFFLDLTHSNDPFRSLWLSVGACVLTGLVLMPLDLIRIKFMITQPNHGLPFNNNIKSGEVSTLNSSLHGGKKDDLVEQAAEEILQNTRSIRESIRYFPTYYLTHPSTPIVLLTTFYQFSTSIFRRAAPYLLFIKFNIDAYSSPAVYTFINLVSLICEFFIKLPVENLLRKEQVSFLLKPKKHDLRKVITIVKPEENLIVEFNGFSLSSQENRMGWIQRIKLLGLFNGWRVGLMNVVGFWGYNIIKHNSYEFKEERL